MSQQSSNNDVSLQQGRLGLSLLNSMIGEYLEKENNPLAIPIGLYYQSTKLSFEYPLAGQIQEPLTNKVAIFVHGLANLENVWDYPPDDGTTSSIVSHYIDVCLDSAPEYEQQNYGSKLHSEHGFTPLFLRYNTGLSLEKNARHFCRLLNQLSEQYPIGIDDLVLIGCGVGGKLLSYTQYTAKQSKSPWLDSLSRCLYLGNLNEASFFTLFLQLSSHLIRQLPMDYGNALADWIDLRVKQFQIQKESASFKQSRNIKRDPTWAFLEDTQHLFINGGLKPSSMDSQNTAIPPDAPAHSQKVFIEGISPIRLTHSDRVYQLLSAWVASGAKVSTEYHKRSVQSLNAVKQHELDLSPPNDGITNKVFIAGTVDLLASAYDKTVEAIETMHYSMVEEPFYAMDKVPVVSQIAKPVEAAQREMLDSMYRGLRKSGKKIHKYASDIV